MIKKVKTLESIINKHVYSHAMPHILAHLNRFVEDMVVINDKVYLLQKKLGEQKANELINEIKNEAFANPNVVNSKYILDKIDVALATIN